MKWIVFCGAAVLAAAVSFGAPPDAVAPAAPADGVDSAVRARVQRTIRALTGPLELTADQGIRLAPLLERHQQAVQTLRERWSGQPEQEARDGFRADLLELRQALRQEMTGILTPDQIDRFEELRRQNRRRGAAAQEPE